MAGGKYIEKQRVLKFIEDIPFADEDKKKFQSALEESNVDELLLNELHDQLMKIPQEKFNGELMRIKYSTELKKLIQQWRMRNASKQFKHGH